ncbi:MAG: insulinase family protein [Desulfobacterales bacterium]
MANGFRYVLLENAKPKDRVSLHLVVNVGAIHENDDERGLAHFLEHMLFNGSTHFAPGELVKYFQKIGMQFGPDANASTGFFRTVYDINLPQSDRASLDEALLVISDYAEGALLLPEEIEREREVILAEKRTRDSAEYRTYVASLQFELAGTRYPDRLPIGTEDVIRGADREKFKAFYDAWYRPDNMVLVMVGDYDRTGAEALIEQRFGGMRPRRESPPEPNTGRLQQRDTPTVFYHYEPEVGNTTITLQALQTVPRAVESRADKQERMEGRLIGSILQARLDRLLNQPDPPFTEASAGIGRFLREFQYGYISADCQPQNWQATLVSIERVLRQALEYGFNSVEVDRARRDFMAELERRVDQAATRESRTLARELIHTVTADRVFQSPRQEKALYAPLLEAVTPGDLNTRLRQAWPSDERKIMVTGNTQLASEVADPATVIERAYRAAARQPVEAPEIAQAARFPYFSPPPPATAPTADREWIEDLAITRLTLANGIRLNFKPTSFSANEILFALSLEGGRAVEPLDQPGLADLTREVLNESGVGPLDREALQIALTGKTTSMSFGFDQDRFFFEGASTPREIELLFQLLYAHMTDPAFRPVAYRLAQERFAQDYQQMAQSIDGAFRVHAQRFLSGGDPRFGKPRLQEVQRLKIVDVQKWIQPLFAESPLEFSMVGDFDLETAVALAQQYLGGLPGNRRRGVNVQPGPVFPSGQNKRVRIDTQIEKALLVVAYPTADASDIRRTRRLNVLAEIFSERLREEIREKRGAAYSTGAFSWPSRAFPGFGLLVSYLPIAPSDLDPIAADVRKIAGQLAVEGIHAEELERALEPTLTGIREQLRQNRYWLRTVLMGSSRYPEQIAWSRDILSDYAGIQLQEVSALARQYLDPAKAAVFEARPAGRAQFGNAEPSG